MTERTLTGFAWYQKPITETETADMETFETDDYDLTKLTELALKHDSAVSLTRFMLMVI